MAFPEKNWLGFRRGWKDLGQIKYSSCFEDGEYRYTGVVHNLCGNRGRVGKEGDKLFKFCPVCEVKLVP